MSRIILSLVTLMLGACATPLAIEGRYASRLSADDVQQIKFLVDQRRDVPKPILKIDAFERGRADVETRQSLGSKLRVHFTVTKRRTGWSVDEGSIEWERIVILD